MNARNLAMRAYSGNAAPTRAPRGAEYEVIARITHRMKNAAMQGQMGFAALVDALQENRKLWKTLAIDVADSENALPKDVRARVFYLAKFTNEHTSQVLQKQATVAPLLEINTAILRGLRQQRAQK